MWRLQLSIGFLLILLNMGIDIEKWFIMDGPVYWDKQKRYDKLGSCKQHTGHCIGLIQHQNTLSFGDFVLYYLLGPDICSVLFLLLMLIYNWYSAQRCNLHLYKHIYKYSIFWYWWYIKTGFVKTFHKNCSRLVFKQCHYKLLSSHGCN